MRYSQFLRDLIRNYNYDPESLAGSYSIVSETRENFTQRYRDSKQPMIFEKISNGIFWLIQEGDSTYWLFPQAKLKVDEFNYRSLQILFECRGFQDDYPTEFSLIRPAKLFLIEGTEQFEHEARGILDFSGHTTESTLGKRLIDLESFMVDTQIFFNQNTGDDLKQEAPPFMSLVEEQLTQLSHKIEGLPQQVLEQVSQSLEERLQPIETQVNQLNQQRQADKKQQTDIQSGIFFINHIIKEVPTQILEQVSQFLEERLQPIEAQIHQLNQQQQQDIQSNVALINQAIAAFPAQITQQLEKRLNEIETKVNQLNQNHQQVALPKQTIQTGNQSLDDNLSDSSDEKPDLSQYAKDLIEQYNKGEANFSQLYQYGLLTLSKTAKDFGGNYKLGQEERKENAKYSQFIDDRNGIFWAIKDSISNNYLLFLNQDRFNPKQFKNTFEFIFKHVNQVFDGVNMYNKSLHTGVKIIYPAIVVKQGDQLELKVRGELEFY